jgi:hypothetical protein
MYCPICGDRMDTEGETLKCVRGEMVLSMDMAKGLHESFVARSVPPKNLLAWDHHRSVGEGFGIVPGAAFKCGMFPGRTASNARSAEGTLARSFIC